MLRWKVIARLVFSLAEADWSDVYIFSCYLSELVVQENMLWAVKINNKKNLCTESIFPIHRYVFDWVKTFFSCLLLISVKKRDRRTWGNLNFSQELTRQALSPQLLTINRMDIVTQICQFKKLWNLFQINDIYNS